MKRSSEKKTLIAVRLTRAKRNFVAQLFWLVVVIGGILAAAFIARSCE